MENPYPTNQVDNPATWPQLLRIDSEALSRELSEQPALWAKFALRAAESNLAYETTRAELSFLEAQLNQQLRHQYREQQERTTEKQLETEVLLHPEIQQKREELLEKRYRRDQYRVMVQALEQRLQALLTLQAAL